MKGGNGQMQDKRHSAGAQAKAVLFEFYNYQRSHRVLDYQMQIRCWS